MTIDELWENAKNDKSIPYAFMTEMAHLLGGKVAPASDREYGRAQLAFAEKIPLWANIGKDSLNVWMSHGDKVLAPPPGFCVSARTASIEVAAMADVKKRLYALQFHPEVAHSEDGEKILRNFLFEIAGLKPTWNMSSFIDSVLTELTENTLRPRSRPTAPR